MRTAFAIGAVIAGVGALSLAGVAGSFSESEPAPDTKMPASVRIPIHP
jgi:hypothetical protein